MLEPESWKNLDGLVAGFGTRTTQSPPEARLARQVHGADVVLCDDLGPGEHADVRGDALVATRSGVVVAVKTADCVPVLLAATPSRAHGRWAAAVHAGWRGAAAGVVGAAVADAVDRGHEGSVLRAAIGPSIGSCCYEVGEEVASIFRRLDLPVNEASPKPRLDLAAIARHLLLRAGLTSGNIEMLAPCTRCNGDRFHSHRASPDRPGRQVSWVGWRK
jgi:YfiH family protein